MSYVNISLIILYAMVCIAIGIWSGRKQGSEDYMIAGRTMKLWPFIASVVASYVGGAAIVAYSAYVYQFGISAVAVFVGTAIGFLVFIPYAIRIRQISDKQEFHTLSDWFYYHYDNKTGMVSAIILFVVYFGMLLNQFIAGSSILSGISGWTYEQALIFSSIIITVYLLFGGFRSVVRTDVFQYVVLFILFILLAYLLFSSERDYAVSLFDLKDMDVGMTIAFIAFGVFIIFQSAEYWQRVYAARDVDVIRKGFRGSAVFVLLTGLAIAVVGLAARHGIEGLEARNAFGEGLRLLMPQKFIGIGLLLMFAAIMSSADTIIFVLASSLAKDYSRVIFKKTPTGKQLKNTTRLFILLFSIAGFAFAWFVRDLVAVIIFITGIGFIIIPAAIASFHYKMKSISVFISFMGGLLYIVVLILSGNLVAEAAIASIIVSALCLSISHIVNKPPNLPDHEE